MNKEQAIKLLRKETSVDEIHRLEVEEKLDFNEVTDKIQEAMDMGIEALEKQIFKFVECKGWNGHSGTRYKCPTCKKIIRCGYEYCSNCGQAVKFPKTKLVDGRIVLDWSEADENKEDN